MAKHKIALIPGDGIGKEVLPEGVRVLEAAARRFNFELDFTEYDIGVAQPWEMIRPRQFDKTRSRNSFRRVAARPKFDRQITRAMQKECRDADRGEYVPNVDFGVHRDERSDSRRTRAHSQQAAPPL